MEGARVEWAKVGPLSWLISSYFNLVVVLNRLGVAPIRVIKKVAMLVIFEC
jgi:hypothetical protein